MAEWVKIAEYNGMECWEVTLTAADPNSAILKLDHTKKAFLAGVTSGGATHGHVHVGLDDPRVLSPRLFCVRDNFASTNHEDGIIELPQPCTSVQIDGTIGAGESLVAQLIQSTLRS